MALENKKLSTYDDLASANIDTTTKLVVLTGATKINANLPVADFIEDTLTSSSVIKPLSAKQGKALQDSKAALASPTFTGTVTLPSTTSIGTVSSTEIGYLDGVTSAIQTQMNLNAPKADPVFTGTISGPDGVTESLFIKAGDQQIIAYTVNEIEVDAILKLGSRGHGIVTELTGDRINISTNPFGTVLTLPVFADNAAALAGTLNDGDLYRTSTGIVMITYAV